jgi:hypothetical protein
MRMPLYIVFPNCDGRSAIAGAHSFTGIHADGYGTAELPGSNFGIFYGLPQINPLTIKRLTQLHHKTKRGVAFLALHSIKGFRCDTDLTSDGSFV